jgi:hypothetical protein
MDNIILSSEELSTILDLKNKKDLLINSFGILETEYQSEKINLLNQLQEINTIQEKLGVLLQQKYGEGIINLNSGTFIKT